ncbi:MAG TPA: IS1634 family transposase [Thermoanaerobacterales bacterium]|nr:IS1634 family transposase [Thermoanaerobacterales bacterium]
MFLKKDKRPNGRIYLSIVEGYRDHETKKPKQRKVKSLGFLDDLEKEYDDPISHFSLLAKQMTEEAKNKELPLDFSFSPDETIDPSTVLRKNLGFSVLSYFYHKLRINNFFINRQRNLSIDYSLNNIFQMLVYSRVLDPCSKKSSFENMDNYFLDFNFGINDVYRALDYFNFYKDDLLLHIHEMIRMTYGRDTSNVYYDVTNYYFEIKEPDDFRKKGVSKEHRPNPVIQMGLLMDNLGLPITYKLFEGNTNDCSTLMPVLNDLKDDYSLGRIIVVADKGMNTGENIAYNILHKNGYIYSQTVRGANADLKEYVLSDEGYEEFSDGFKIKSRIITTNIWVENVSGKKVQVPIEQKQVVFYSPDYAERARYEREKAIEKAKKLINNTKNGKMLKKGSFKYIISTPVDKNTGEIYEYTDIHSIDEEKIKEEEKFDGYYAIVTSELEMPNQEILDAYRNLWRIEETFKITKSELKTRPVYLSKKEHIKAHFLTCFVSLLLLRLIQMNTDEKYTTKTLIDEMRNITGTYVDKNYYMFDYYNEIVKDLGKTVGINFSKRFMTLGEIKKIISQMKN